MKRFLKIFGIVLAVLAIALLVAFILFKTLYVPTHLREDPIDDIVVELPVKEPEKEPEEEVVIVKTEEELWQETINESDRVNLLLFGTDGQRADTLIVVSYSKEDKDISLITVPRDTYNLVEGKDLQGHHKVNAVFSWLGGTEGAVQQKEEIEKMVGIPIHYYVKVNYWGLKAVVDTLGGIQVYVPFDMSYDDIYAVPELHIHLNEGSQVLNGQKAMEYIRWRKNNNGWGDSDLERGKRQQDFIIKVVKKSFSFKIVEIIDVCYDYVTTNMSVEDALYYGSELVGFDFDTIQSHVLPGEPEYIDGTSYYVKDEAGILELIQSIYGFEYSNE